MRLPRKNIYTTQSGLWVSQLALPALQESWVLSAWPGLINALCTSFEISIETKSTAKSTVLAKHIQDLWQLLRPLKSWASFSTPISVKLRSGNHRRGEKWQSKRGLAASFSSEKGKCGNFPSKHPSKKQKSSQAARTMAGIPGSRPKDSFKSIFHEDWAEYRVLKPRTAH